MICMKHPLRTRRSIAVILVALLVGTILYLHPNLQEPVAPPSSHQNTTGSAITTLEELAVKGRAPKTGYTRAQFGDGWGEINGCDTRNIILHRDLKNTLLNDKCQVMSGLLDDPYTGKTIQFTRGAGTSDDIQIDHVVALSDAWQKGAQQLVADERIRLANDPLELLAVDGPSNQQKGDGDAATWLPPNKAFRCQYVARQIAVKKKYRLWVTQAEKEAMQLILSNCHDQMIPG